MEQQPGTKAHQARRVKARVVDQQVEGDLPAQIEANGVHRPLVGEPSQASLHLPESDELQGKAMETGGQTRRFSHPDFFSGLLVKCDIRRWE